MRVYAADAVSDAIRITLFNDAVDWFQAVVAPGNTCYFSAGRIKLTAYASAGVTCEATFGAEADIHVAEDNLPIQLKYVLSRRLLLEILIFCSVSTMHRANSSNLDL